MAEAELDPFFVFHHVNAFETGDRISLDVCAHKDAGIIDALYLKRLRAADQRLPHTNVRRIEVRSGTGKATVRDLSDADLELPRINYGAGATAAPTATSMARASGTSAAAASWTSC